MGSEAGYNKTRFLEATNRIFGQQVIQLLHKSFHGWGRQAN
jgi:hypothetical protein